MDIWIVEEKVTNKFIGDLGHLILLARGYK